MTYNKGFLLSLVRFFIIALLVSSCVSPKDVVYFQGTSDLEKLVSTVNFEPTYQVDDILNIIVSTENPESSRPFNQLAAGEGEEAATLGYLIDNQGDILFPVIGRIKLAGLTRNEASQKLIKELEIYLKNPTVDIRISNFKITVTGSVASPGSYTIPNERLTIIEAIGLAGDLTIKGKRDNVLVIRDAEGVRQFFRIDMTSKDIFNSPVYYLRQNDVVYIEPNISEIRNAGSNPNLFAVILSITGLGIGIATLVTTLNNN